MKHFKLVLTGIAILLLAIWIPAKKLTGNSKVIQLHKTLVQHDKECDAEKQSCNNQLCTPLSFTY